MSTSTDSRGFAFECPVTPQPRTVSIWAALVAIAVLMIGFLEAPVHAQAADSYGLTSVLSVTANPASKTIKIVYKNAAALPALAVPSARTRYYETVRAGYLETKRFSPKKGTHTLILRATGLHIVTVEIFGIRGVNPRKYNRLIKPGKFSTSRVVTASEAIARAIAINVPGFVLTVFPQTKMLRYAGGLVLGWSVFSSVKGAVTGYAGTCPSVAAGQYIESTTTWSQSGSSVKTVSTYKVWHRKADRTARKAAACTVVNTFTYR